MRSKQTDPLTIALHMREAVGYLAALASKSELDKIAHKLLGVHLELGAKIDALIEKQNGERAAPTPATASDRKLKPIPH